MTKVKICGITNLEDALFCQRAGADYLGFIFYKGSPRFISVQHAKSITQALHCKKVGVFVNHSEAFIIHTAKLCRLDYVQLHGDEDIAFSDRIQERINVIKAIRVLDEHYINGAAGFSSSFLLFDTFSPSRYGGTGDVFDLTILKNFERDFFLAGGLNEQNIAHCIQKSCPFGVDINSGVEKKPGEKDPLKVKKIITMIRRLSICN